jgi:hypothetical protein
MSPGLRILSDDGAEQPEVALGRHREQLVRSHEGDP